MIDSPDISNQMLKAGGSIGGAIFAGLTLNEWAALSTIVYTVILIGEWLWKRVLRPRLLTRGLIAPKGGIIVNPSDGE